MMLIEKALQHMQIRFGIDVSCSVDRPYCSDDIALTDELGARKVSDYPTNT
jgi:hypothetical protein